MLPNGGFPPIKKCKEEKRQKVDKKDEKGFFYTTNNNINIRDILKKNSNKDTLKPRDDDELDIIE